MKTFALRVQMKPVAGNIDGSPQLKEESPFWIEHSQNKTQAHGRTSINEHVKHGAKFRA
jgi:hypothetical protein